MTAEIFSSKNGTLCISKETVVAYAVNKISEDAVFFFFFFFFINCKMAGLERKQSVVTRTNLYAYSFN